MICEHCHFREATVHYALVIEPGAEPTAHAYCEACYAVIEAETLRSYGASSRTPTAPMPEVETITASEFLELQARARKSSADAPTLRAINRRLEQLPKTRARLAVEFLELAWGALERGEDPGLLIGGAGVFWNPAAPERQQEYTVRIEKIIRRMFAMLDPPARQGSEPSTLGAREWLAWDLVFAASALRKADSGRYSAVMDHLRGECAKSGSAVSRTVMAELEKRLEE